MHIYVYVIKKGCLQVDMCLYKIFDCIFLKLHSIIWTFIIVHIDGAVGTSICVTQLVGAVLHFIFHI